MAFIENTDASDNGISGALSQIIWAMRRLLSKLKGIPVSCIPIYLYFSLHQQTDVITAFWNGKIKSEVYMYPPEG